MSNWTGIACTRGGGGERKGWKRRWPPLALCPATAKWDRPHVIIDVNRDGCQLIRVHLHTSPREPAARAGAIIWIHQRHLVGTGCASSDHHQISIAIQAPPIASWIFISGRRRWYGLTTGVGSCSLTTLKWIVNNCFRRERQRQLLSSVGGGIDFD